jgi:hypothetical protein
MSFADENKNSDFIRNYKRFQEQFDSLFWKKNPDWYLNFKEFENEEFKSIDEYQGFYFISNYGKVISFKRKLPGVRRASMISGYLTITLNHFGSTKLHYIHELVYTHFVGKIESFQRIRHKDNNPENNFYKNLEKVSMAELLDKEDSKDNSESAESKSEIAEAPMVSTGSKRRKKPLKPKQTRKLFLNLDEFDPGVLQFSKAGKFICEHYSIRDAAGEIGVEPREILNCLKGDFKTAGGYQWRYSVDPNFDEGIFDIKPVDDITTSEKPVLKSEKPKEKAGKGRSKPIGQYDWSGNLIRIFPSIKEAAEEIGITAGAISFSMQKPNRRAAGFTWKPV